MFLKSFKRFSSSIEYKEFFFNRSKEIELLKGVLSRKPQLTIISGGNDTGKSSLINKVLYKESFEKKLNLIHIDFRNQFCDDEVDLANAFLTKCPENIITTIKSKIPEIEKIELPKYGNIKFYNIEKKSSALFVLKEILNRIEKSIPDFSPFNGALTPILFIDEANELKNLENNQTGKIALDYLIRWIILNTKQNPKIHVMLATSDSFFVHKIGVITGERCENITIGDLNYEEAKKYFEILCKDLDVKDLDFKKDVYDYVGGRMFLIERVINDYLSYRKKCKDSNMLSNRFDKYYEALDIEKNANGLVYIKCKARWEKETLKYAMNEIATRGFFHLKDKNREEILSMVENNLFIFRKTPPISEDIPGLNYEEYKKGSIIVSPSALDLYAIKKIVQDKFIF